jgi:hypothetical protein
VERDPADESLQLERLGQLGRLVHPREHRRRRVRDGLHRRQLVVAEHPRAADGAERDGDDAVARAHRDEDAALGPRDRVQARVDDVRALRVVDREGGALADDRVDPGRLPVEGDRLPDERGVVRAAVTRGGEDGAGAVVLDPGEVDELEPEGGGELVQKSHGGLVGRRGGEERPRQRRLHARRRLPALAQHPRAPARGRGRDRGSGAQRRADERRHRSDQHRLETCVHWAGFTGAPDDRDAHPALKDGPTGLLASPPFGG